MKINKVVASYLLPKPEIFERFAEGVEKALKEAVSRFEVDLAEGGPPAGNVDPIR